MAWLNLTTEEGMQTYLQQKLYPACNLVERLSEGASGFVFRAHYQEGGHPSTVVVKHVEGYAARAISWKLDQERMHFEHEGLKFLSDMRMQEDILIRTPKVLHYDAKKYVLILKDAGNLPSLKGWLQSGLDPRTVQTVGAALGKYLAKVHNISSGDEELLRNFDGNATAKFLSGTLYFGGLPAVAEQYGYKDDFFARAASLGQNEVNDANEVLTLGDFWTGNILVSDSPDLKIFVVDFELAKPGTAAFDVGQMAAEMYFLAAFRDLTLGMSLLESFLTSYKQHRHGRIDVAKVAIRVGAHFFVIMPNAWRSVASHEQIGSLLKIGAELLRMGVAGDLVGLEKSLLQKLL